MTQITLMSDTHSRVMLREHSCLTRKPCRVEGTSLSRFLLVVTKNVQKSKRTFVFVSTCIEIRKDGYI